MSPSSESPHDAPQVCPYWHQVASDFANMYPAGGYCIAGCHKRIKVMAGQTVEQVCAMAFAECEGYQRALAEQEAKEQKASDTIWR